MSKNDESDDSDVEIVEVTLPTRENANQRLTDKSKNIYQLVKDDSQKSVNRGNLRLSRRKSQHKVINTHDEILFESFPTANKTPIKVKSIRAMPYNPTLKPMEKGNTSGDKIQPKPRPIPKQGEISTRINTTTIEYMHRIAFLRACINYMLRAVGKQPMKFEENGETLSNLFRKYSTISNKLTCDEVIGLD